MNTGKVTLMTFGFKYGHPNCNYWFDVSFIPNPVRQKGRTLHDKYDSKMLEFVAEQEGASQMVETITGLIRNVSRLDDDVRIGIGCNSGRHRSRAIADLVVASLSDLQVILVHREDRPNLE